MNVLAILGLIVKYAGYLSALMGLMRTAQAVFPKGSGPKKAEAVMGFMEGAITATQGISTGGQKETMGEIKQLIDSLKPIMFPKQNSIIDDLSPRQ